MQQQRKVHRRKKQQIVKLFKCGDPLCLKSYGTNAALYTHIKNKHQGIQPHNTNRPIIQSAKGKKGRPIFQQKCYPSSPIIDILKQQKNIKLIYSIGLFGVIKQNLNLIVRLPQQDSQFKEQKLITAKNKMNKLVEIKETNKNLLQVISKYWKDEVQQEIYCLFYLIKSLKGNLSQILKFLNNNKNLFKICNYLIQKHNKTFPLNNICKLHQII